MALTYHSSDIAVALKYDGTAEQILAIAEQHGIPLQAEPELVKILAEIPLGEEIPNELYTAVAEVLAFAYFLSGKTPDTPHL
jgi:flagellar biosynthesis protein